MTDAVVAKIPSPLLDAVVTVGPVSTSGHDIAANGKSGDEPDSQKKKRLLASELCTRRITGDDSEKMDMYN